MSLASMISAPSAARFSPTCAIAPFFTSTSARGSVPIFGSTVITAPFLMR